MADTKTRRFYCPSHWTLTERMAHYTAPPDARGCTLWTGPRHNQGYGYLAVRGRKRLTHRLAWEIANGAPPPDDKCVCHACDIRLCVNTNHLFLDTRTGNARDRTAKERDARGSENGAAMLTEAQIVAIRTDPRLQREIAAEYGVSRSNVGQIKQRLTWRHL